MPVNNWLVYGPGPLKPLNGDLESSCAIEVRGCGLRESSEDPRSSSSFPSKEIAPRTVLPSVGGSRRFDVVDEEIAANGNWSFTALLVPIPAQVCGSFGDEF